MLECEKNISGSYDCTFYDACRNLIFFLLPSLYGRRSKNNNIIWEALSMCQLRKVLDDDYKLPKLTILV